MIEYLYDAVRASAGADITLTAIITDSENQCVEADCALMLHSDDEMIGNFKGDYLGDGIWSFTIPKEYTNKGRYFYCICEKTANLCFKQPIYFV